MKAKIQDAVYIRKFGNGSTLWVAPTGEIMERNSAGTTSLYMPTKNVAMAVAWLSRFWKDRSQLSDGRPCWNGHLPAFYEDDLTAARGYLSIVGITEDGPSGNCRR